LQDHLGTDTTTLAVVAMPVEVFDQPNLQRALDALGPDDGVDVVRVVGMRGEHRNYGAVSLATLTQSNLNLEVGPVDHVERPIDTNRTLTCIDFGLLLLRVGSTPFALLVRGADERRGSSAITVEVMGPDRDAGGELLGRLRALMAKHNVFRGKIVSLTPASPMMRTSVVAHFVERPTLERVDVILPGGTLERIERITIGFSARARSLRAGGRHLRRGLLLHGSPGTGKTHTVRYLLSRLSDRTVFVLSGQGLGGSSSQRSSSSRTLTWSPRSALDPTPGRTPSCSNCSTRWTASRRTPTSSSC